MDTRNTFMPEVNHTNDSDEPNALHSFIHDKIGDMIWIYISPLLLVVGTVGNVLSVLVLLRKQMRRSTTMFYLTCLSLGDLFTLYTGLLRYLIKNVFGTDVRNFSDTGCKIHVFLVYVSLDFSVWILVAVTIDRCLFVTMPFKARRICTLSRCRIVVVIILVVLTLKNMHFLWNMKVVTLWEVICEGKSESVRHFIWFVWPWIDFSTFCLIPFTIMIVCNMRIIYHIVLSQRQLQAHTRRLTNSQTSSQEPPATHVPICDQSDKTEGADRFKDQGDANTNYTTVPATSVSNYDRSDKTEDAVGFEDQGFANTSITTLPVIPVSNCDRSHKTEGALGFKDQLVANTFKTTPVPATPLSNYDGSDKTEGADRFKDQGVASASNTTVHATPVSNNDRSDTTEGAVGFEDQGVANTSKTRSVPANPLSNYDRSDKTEGAVRLKDHRVANTSNTSPVLANLESNYDRSNRIKGAVGFKYQGVANRTSRAVPPTLPRKSPTLVSTVTTTLLTVNCVFLVTTTPIQVFLIGEHYWYPNKTPEELAGSNFWWSVTNILQYSNNCMHFFLYCLTGPRFRHELKCMFKRRHRVSVAGEHVSDTEHKDM